MKDYTQDPTQTKDSNSYNTNNWNKKNFAESAALPSADLPSSALPSSDLSNPSIMLDDNYSNKQINKMTRRFESSPAQIDVVWRDLSFVAPSVERNKPRATTDPAIRMRQSKKCNTHTPPPKPYYPWQYSNKL